MNFFFPPDFHFLHPYFSLAFLLLFPIGYLFYKTSLQKKQNDKVFHQNFYNPKKEMTNFIALMIAISCIIFAMMGPVGYMKREEDPILASSKLDQPLPVLFLLDTSLSMATQDASFHKSRFDEAVEIISTLLPELNKTPKAFYTFNDHLQQIVPVTFDSTFINLILDSLSPSGSSEGTRFLPTFKELLATLNTKDAVKPRQIILITDGEDTDVKPDTQEIFDIISEFAKGGIIFNVIGVGSADGGPIPDITFHEKPVISHLNEPFLIEMAHLGDGHYYNARNISIKGITSDIIGHVQANTYESLYTTHPTVSFVPLYPTFIIIALLLFLRGFVN